jgi:hypothetical protein
MGRKRRTQRVQTGADLDRAKAEDTILKFRRNARCGSIL